MMMMMMMMIIMMSGAEVGLSIVHALVFMFRCNNNSCYLSID